MAFSRAPSLTNLADGDSVSTYASSLGQVQPLHSLACWGNDSAYKQLPGHFLTSSNSPGGWLGECLFATVYMSRDS
jgi:hypothetical protein